MAAHEQRILFVDAYDSFAHNIVGLLQQETKAQISLIRLDSDIEAVFGKPLREVIESYDAIVLGPGPGNPNNAADTGIFYDVYDICQQTGTPVLGVCLGFQALCVKYGLPIGSMRFPCHGQPKQIFYYEQGEPANGDKDIFEDVDRSNIWATCYNSLCLFLENGPQTPTPEDNFRILGIDYENVVQAIKHTKFPFWGFQYHPESCKSNEGCHKLINNWWKVAQWVNSQPKRAEYMLKIAKVNQPKVDVSLGSIKKVDFRSQATREAIAQHLAQAAATTGNTVCWKKIPATCTRTQLSDLCHDLAEKKHIIMLESTRLGRFSVYAVMCGDPLTKGMARSNGSWHAIYSGDHVFSVESSDKEKNFSIAAGREDVYAGLKTLMTSKAATGGSDEIPFWGGFMGFMSYEHGLEGLEVKSRGPKHQPTPEMNLAWVERSLVHDNETNSIFIQSIKTDDDKFVTDMTALLSDKTNSWARTDAMLEKNSANLQRILNTATIGLPDKDFYFTNYEKCQKALHSGNSYELCLTTEATITIPKITPADAMSTVASYDFELYKNLHKSNPVPYGGFVRFPGITILGTSPEQYICWDRDGIMDMIPMKGTVKRGPDMTYEKACEILETPKEVGENLMIADLIRHDLYNTVGHENGAKVDVYKLCEVIEHETTYQSVSHLRAYAPVNNEATALDKTKKVMHYGLQALRQTMPPGSMTGAPKKRSCDILADMEGRHRGLYSGVLGFLDVGGAGSWNVCIRTAYKTDEESKAIKGDKWILGAGGAITVLSTCEGEWEEMMVKVGSVLEGFKHVNA